MFVSQMHCSIFHQGTFRGGLCVFFISVVKFYGRIILTRKMQIYIYNRSLQFSTRNIGNMLLKRCIFGYPKHLNFVAYEKPSVDREKTLTLPPKIYMVGPLPHI